MEFGARSLQIVDSAIPRKWKWLFVNGCESKSTISSGTEFLKHVPRWDNCISISVFGDYVGKEWQLSGINDLHTAL